MDASGYFLGKRITVMGLGLLGRGVGDAKFLASCGADLIVTDLKTEEQLQSSLAELKSFSNITYRLGGHDLADFRGRDFILKAAGVPLDSPFIAEARKDGIPIKMSASWFAEISGIKTVGVTGTRGKSTVTHMLYDILKLAGKQVLLGGNIRGVSTLSLLPEVTKNSVALLELDSWQCQGWGEAKMSPHVAVFTTFFDDHLNYYKGDRERYLEDKAQIFLHQKEGDVLIVGEQVASLLKKYQDTVAPRLRTAKPRDLRLKIPGIHNQTNAACAYEVALALGISDAAITKALEEFKGVPGRLELLKEINGIKIYNDTTSTTPEATLAALEALGTENLVLIMGGADKELDMSNLIKVLPERVFYLSGSGTEKLGKKGTDLQTAFTSALQSAHEGDVILFSPSFASFGMFKNEFDRGDQFVEIVKKLA